MKKFLTGLVLFLLAALCTVNLAACGVEFKINFIVDGEVYATVKTGGSEMVKMPDNPVKDEYTFDGWFWDKDSWEKPFTANSLLDAPLSSDMSVYAKWKSNHNYIEKITKEPTCTEKGEKTFTCECGDSYTEEINALGHIFTNYVSDNNATYESDGTKTAVCERGCGATDTIPDVGTKIPEITEYFTKQVDGSYYGKVYNTTTNFDFTGKIDSDDGYSVCTDAACTKPLADNKTNLSLGDNIFYVLFDNGTKITATVRRRLIYTVSFDSNGGTELSEQQIEEDRHALTPPNPRRVGYTFNTWDRDFNEPITANTTITALWNANTNTPYKIEYYLQNLENSNFTLQESDTEYLTGTTDTTVAAEIKTYEHFKYYKNLSKISGNINPDGTTVLKVYYTRNRYSVNLTSIGKAGKVSGAGNYANAQNANISLSLNSGYTFLGWFNGDKLVSENYSFYFNPTENITLTAKCTPNDNTPYKIEYYLQNLEDENYTLQESDTEYLTGTTDTTASKTADKTYEHYIIKNNTLSSNISGNGTTALKFYYNLEKFAVNISSDSPNVSLSESYSGEFKYGTFIDDITATVNLGYDWQGWYNDNELITNNFKISSFIVENSINYAAKCTLKEEMLNFEFTSTDKTCIITGVKDKTVDEIEIPNYITDIGEKAFLNCYNLKSLHIPISVNTISDYAAFANCSSLKNIIVDAENIIYHSAGNCLIETQTKTLILGCKNSIIPTDGSVTSIGNYAFYGCSGLTNISIPDSVMSIENYAFKNCSSLTSITIPDNLTSIGNDAFYGCSSLTSITIPNSVTSIGNYAFYGCSSLKSIAIPKSVTSIGNYAFYGCSGLTNISIPDSVTSIGHSAFFNCSSLTKIIFADTTTWYRTNNSTNWQNKTGGTLTDLTNTSTNATNFRVNYYTYYWYKI